MSRLISVRVTMHFPKAAYPIDSLRMSADATMPSVRLLYLVVRCPRRDLTRLARKSPTVGALRRDGRSSRGLLWYPTLIVPVCASSSSGCKYAGRTRDCTGLWVNVIAFTEVIPIDANYSALVSYHFHLVRARRHHFTRGVTSLHAMSTGEVFHDQPRPEATKSAVLRHFRARVRPQR